MGVPAILAFDIGRSNWKAFVFNERYQTLLEKSQEVIEIKDEDDFPCEDLSALSSWVLQTLDEVLANREIDIKAVNFSAHGAAFVNIDDYGLPVTPLYNYLKPFPEPLKNEFYNKYEGEDNFSLRTASPVLGHLNVGMQLYWLKNERPKAFERIKYSLFIPQYLSLLLGGKPCTDITSIGCHTNLWDFQQEQYHPWVQQERVGSKLAPILPGNKVTQITRNDHTFLCGIGLHDSSSAMVPYLKLNKEPFALISTGTWSITMNPFNNSPLTADELKQDCLCYIRYDGQPLKASRLLAGPEHQNQVTKIAEHYHVEPHFYQGIPFHKEWLQELELRPKELTDCGSAEEAYHQAMIAMIHSQEKSTSLVVAGTPVKTIFVDGGFSRNDVFMQLLARAFPKQTIKSSQVKQAAAWGVAMILHEQWNSLNIDDVIRL